MLLSFQGLCRKSLSSLPQLVRHREAVLKLADLEAFPSSGVWACPVLTSSHVAAKLKHKLSLLPHPAAMYPNCGLRPHFLPVPFSFLLSPQVQLIDGRETWVCGQMGTRPCNSWSAWFGWSGDQDTRWPKMFCKMHPAYSPSCSRSVTHEQEWICYL